MQRAGEAVAALAWQRWLAGRVAPRVAVFAGPGNNGGDAFVAATALQAHGARVQVFAAGREQTSVEARTARAAFVGSLTLASLPADADHFDCVIDGLLGIGANRQLQGWLRDAVDWINACAAPVLAIDVPSGLDADRGSVPPGSIAVQADTTLTFLTHKTGLFSAAARAHCGELLLNTLGVAPPESACQLNTPVLFAAALPRANSTAHKGQRGDLWVIGGAPGMVGAAVLAARAAHACGVGRVLMAPQHAEAFPVDPLCPEIMVRDGMTLIGKTLGADAVVAGCGLSTLPAGLQRLTHALGVDAALVLDADALNLLAQRPALGKPLKARKRPAIITPHPLEAARLLGVDAAAIEADRLAAACKLAEKFKAVCLLKGAASIIMAPDGRSAITTNGHPILATGGTGDLLAGIAGALLAGGMPAFEAACAASYVHAQAGAELAAASGGARGFSSAAFLALLPRLLNRLSVPA